MKVSNVGSTRSTESARHKKAGGVGSGEFADHLRDSAAVPAGPLGTPAVGGVDGMLAAQEVGDALDERGRKQVVDHGGQLLDRLDQLRVKLLEGSIPKDQLADLARQMRARRRSIDDPRLQEIIDAIELRAKVEIAKLTRET